MTGFADDTRERTVVSALDRRLPLDDLAGDDATIAAAWLEQLDRAGVEIQAHEPSLYLSVPERAELIVNGSPVPCRPAAFCRATRADRVEGAAARVDGESDAMLVDRIAIIDGPVDPGTAYRVEHRGASAQVFIAPDALTRIVSSSTIWGAPTHESMMRRPRTPVVVVPSAEGERLLRDAQAGASVSIATWLDEGWRPTVVPVAHIPGTQDPDEFVLVHGGDAAALLAMARALHACRSDLKRSVRVGWWPARAESSFGASAWYADAHSGEIDQWCVAHLSVEAPADAGLAEVTWMSEGAELCLDAIAAVDAESVKGRRPARGGSYSFNQIGVSGVFGGRRFARDLHAYLTVVTRLVTSPIYPLDYTATVLEIGAAVQRYQAAAGNELGLGGVSQDLGALRRAIGAWRSNAENAVRDRPSDDSLRRVVNGTLRRLSRVLVPLAYARGERFDHDPAVRFSAVPRLEAALHVASVPETMKPLVRTALLREQNKIRAAIREAHRLVT